MSMQMFFNKINVLELLRCKVFYLRFSMFLYNFYILTQKHQCQFLKNGGLYVTKMYTKEFCHPIKSYYIDTFNKQKT